MTERDLAKLQGCHPELVARISKVLDAMTVLGVPMIVTDGVRTTAQQRALYAKGRTVPGPIVTNADGVTKLSNHQIKGDGFGHACDVAFLVNGQPSWDSRLPWKCYGACVEALGLVWGGSWTALHDLPHAEWSG
jgi:peptidoglycan L-alanyl-D-glutamate endopeptidase CwlK